KRLDVTPMSLYRHVGTHEELLRTLSARVYADVLAPPDPSLAPLLEVSALLSRYYMAIGRHPQLTLAIFSAPQAFAGVTREITDRLTALLATVTDQPVQWRDILIDHAHGSGLALVVARGDPVQARAMTAQYQQALACLLQRLSVHVP
ncbi:hypothetical protein P3G55_23050, partial [Leptospira sp. 96542]|nr:hypothetical protein [Leptospira sp. 96542]